MSYYYALISEETKELSDASGPSTLLTLLDSLLCLFSLNKRQPTDDNDNCDD